MRKPPGLAFHARFVVLFLFALARPAGAGVDVHACGEARPATAPRTIHVVAQGTTLARPARVLAVLNVETSGPRGLKSPDDAYWLDQLRGPAAKLGADAIVGLHTLHFSDRGRFVTTALAVAEDDGATTSAACPRVVALGVEDRVDSPGSPAGSDVPLLVALTRVELEHRGWYVALGNLGPAEPQEVAVRTASERLGVAVGRTLHLSIERADSLPHPTSPAGSLAPMPEVPPLRLSAVLTDATGEPVWHASRVETFQHAGEVASAVLIGLSHSRAGLLASALHHLYEDMPAPVPEVSARR